MTDTKKPDDKPLEVKPPAPAPKAEEKKVETKEAEKPKEVSRRDLLHKQISEALAQYRNLESDIPTNHPYWMWVNEYRGIK